MGGRRTGARALACFHSARAAHLPADWCRRRVGSVEPCGACHCLGACSPIDVCVCSGVRRLYGLGAPPSVLSSGRFGFRSWAITFGSARRTTFPHSEL